MLVCAHLETINEIQLSKCKCMPVPEISMQVCNMEFSGVVIVEEWAIVRIDSSHPKVYVFLC